MKAMVINKYGGPEVFSEVEIPVPHPGPGQVSINVTHSSVGLVDAFIRRGLFPDMFELPLVTGLEVAGTIRELGEGVRDFKIGEPVVTLSLMSLGGYATITVANADFIVSLEGIDVDPAQAVSTLPNATTAYLALTRVAHLQEGESILVHGAIGGLASVFPPVARLLGASQVIGTIRTDSKLDAARQLDYDDIIIASDFPDKVRGHQFHVVIDTVGGDMLASSFDLMAPLGRILVVGNASEREVKINSNMLWLKSLGVFGFSVASVLHTQPRAGQSAAKKLLHILGEGKLTIPVTTLPLKDVAEAHRRLDHKEIVGRIVLVP